MKLRRFRRENVREGFSKLLVFVATAILCLWMVSGARAATVQVTEVKPLSSGTGEGVEISLSGEISESQILAEFQRNFLQLSIKGANAFPAKNANFNGRNLDKTFIYQYQPDLTRARILFKSEAAIIKDQVRWEARGSKILVYIGAPTPAAAALPAVTKAPVRTLGKTPKAPVVDKVSSIASSNEKTASDPLAKEDARLIEAILSEPNKELAPAKVAAPAVALTDATAKARESEVLFADEGTTKKEGKSHVKAQSPVSRMATGLLTVLAIMALVAFGFKKFVLQGRISLNRQGRMVDMVSSYMLSPKKQIAVVRVGKQYMVLGVTDTNISLIQSLGEDASIERYLDEPPAPRGSASLDSGFNQILRKQVEEPEEVAAVEPARPSIRSLIKQRIEGFKPL